MTFECIPANEDKFRDKLIEMLKAKMTRENPTTMHRDAHPKQHGLVKARFSVLQTLPPSVCYGVFKPGSTYDAWVRFSNQNAPALNDYDKDIRGAAIKLMNIPGEKIEMADNNTTSQDFVTISTPKFVTHDVEEFSGLIEALVGGKLKLLWFFLWHPRSLINLMQSNKIYFSPLEARYWSTTPYQLGPDQAVKYSLIPQAKPTPTPKGLSPDFLKENMVKQLSEDTYQFDFAVQLRTKPHIMPIEDPGKEWKESDSSFIKVATLTIDKQCFDTPDQNQYGRDLSFNPWHSLPAHRPLGGINRARRIIYETLSQFRHKQNNAPVHEPSDYNIPQQ